MFLLSLLDVMQISFDMKPLLHIFLYVARLTLVRQRPVKSLSSVCLSVRPYLTKFSQDCIISFFLILYMMIDGHDI